MAMELPNIAESTPAPDVEDVLSRRKNLFTKEETDKAWEDVSSMVKNYSDEMVNRWNKEIDTLLVYAGLFSAILTAFTVQSYPLLQPVVPDPSIVILQQLSLQITSFSNQFPTPNSTRASPAGIPVPDPVSRSVVWLNVLWFSSLVLSLSSASIGILIKQWLNEYNSGISGTSCEVARLRQRRLNNMLEWHVADVVVAIPILLQLSLALFLAGLLILLWSLESTVAATATVFITSLALFTVGTTVLPLVKETCAYLSPQTFLLYLAWQRVTFWISVVNNSTTRPFAGGLWRLCRNRLPLPLESILWRIFVREHKTEILTWRGREQKAILSSYEALDVDILISAYDSTWDPHALSAAAVCLMGHTPDHVLRYFIRLQDIDVGNFGKSPLHPATAIHELRNTKMLYAHAALCAVVADPPKLQVDLDVWRRACHKACCFAAGDISDDLTATQAAWMESALASTYELIECRNEWELRYRTSLRIYVSEAREALLEWTAAHGIPPTKTQTLHVASRIRDLASGRLLLRSRELAYADDRLITSILKGTENFISYAARYILNSQFVPSYSPAVRAFIHLDLCELALFLQRRATSSDTVQEQLWREPTTLESLASICDVLVEHHTVLAALIPDDFVTSVGLVAELLDPTEGNLLGSSRKRVLGGLRQAAQALAEGIHGDASTTTARMPTEHVACLELSSASSTRRPA
ncbi:hypothetical protein C8Q79DRAFT_739345 [Trametes meyenii]|nr:hypothetical protein C8Q79DRAFT_739345 [Trametes meyenii]